MHSNKIGVGDLSTLSINAQGIRTTTGIPKQYRRGYSAVTPRLIRQTSWPKSLTLKQPEQNEIIDADAHFFQHDATTKEYHIASSNRNDSDYYNYYSTHNINNNGSPVPHTHLSSASPPSTPPPSSPSSWFAQQQHANTNSPNPRHFLNNSNSNNGTPGYNNSTVNNVQPPAAPVSSRDEVIIHVYDEASDVNRDFVCKRNILLREMKYFGAYLSDDAAMDDVDISVHCDVNIFQWLMDYIHKRGEDAPRLDSSLAISILISSEFLQMGRLVDECLHFVHDNINDILKLPIDLDCINAKLVARLSDLFSDEELDEVNDKKDKILSKLWLRKVEELLAQEGNTLYRCQLCGKLFTASHYEWMVCPKAKLFIGFHGNVVSQHVPDLRNWDINKFIVSLRIKDGLTWRELYWKLWALTKSFHCMRCNSRFVACELDHCLYHTQDPVYATGSSSSISITTGGFSNVGKYACCGHQSVRFDSGLAIKSGCCAQRHLVSFTSHKITLSDEHDRYGDTDDGNNIDEHRHHDATTGNDNEQERTDFELLLKRQEITLLPFCSSQDGGSSSSSTKPKSSSTNKVTNSCTPFLDADQGMVSDGDEIEYLSDHTGTTASEPTEDEGSSDNDSSDSDYSLYSSEDDNNHNNTTCQAFKSFSTKTKVATILPRTRTSLLLKRNENGSGNAIGTMQQQATAVAARTAAAAVRRKKKKERQILRNISPRKRKMLEMESLRQDDDQKMEDIIAMLQTKRKDKPEDIKKEKKLSVRPPADKKTVSRTKPGRAITPSKKKILL